MHILIVSATDMEIAPCIDYLEKKGTKKSFFDYEYNGHTIYPLVTGVGAMMTAFALARYRDITKVDLAINVGIAGTYHDRLSIGSVVEVTQDRFADLGIEELDGRYADVYEMQLSDGDKYPFRQGWLYNDESKYDTTLPKVTGLTVNKTHGAAQSIAAIQLKYTADIETMETAAFIYACQVMDVDYTALRAISNKVEPRNPANWDIEKAIYELNKELIKYIGSL